MKYQFKTNINCSGCVEQVTPYLNSKEEIQHWNVDTKNLNKVLTVETNKLSEEELRQIVTEAGFTIETVNR